MDNHKNLFSFYPASLDLELTQEMVNFSFNEVLQRLWQHDYTLWSDQRIEIENRMGWLQLHETMLGKLPKIETLVNKLRQENFENAVLLGMGGSSLAPDVFQKVFGTTPGFLKLHILDSTDPDAIENIQLGLNLEKSTFIVSTKSGGTVETLSFFKYFYNLIANQTETDNIGDHFIAITDPGSQLEVIGKRIGFREIFLNDPDIGGRYSALSYFGLVPAAISGIDIHMLLDQAKSAAIENSPTVEPNNSSAAILGGLLGVGAKDGIDKLTFISEESISSFSDWIEQLIAESTGKSGTGILPVVGEQVAEDLSFYGPDRLFVIHSLKGSPKFKNLSKKLQATGHPVVHIDLNTKYEIGKLMLIWEIATVLAGHIMKIHPFNQPNVEAAKELARQTVQSYQEKGRLPQTKTSPLNPETLTSFLSSIQTGDYIAIQAYVNPSTENEEIFRKLQAVLRDRYKVAVTFGFGPRFLHSTGQLHKGDAGKGFFLQFNTNSELMIDIPSEAGNPDSFIRFDVLKKAQALGDAHALKQAKRRLITFSLQEPISEEIREIIKGI